MKKLLLCLFLTIGFFLSSKAQTQGWQQMQSLGSDIATRYSSQMVSYNSKLYFFGGYGGGISSGINDFWEYDPLTKTFKELNRLPSEPFPNAAANNGVAFVIGDNLYFLANYNQLYAYNFITKLWARKSLFPKSYDGYRTTAFVLGNMIYAESYTDNTFYSYNPITDVWTQKANYPGNIISKGFSFSVNNKGYKGGGLLGSTSTQSLAFYEYNPTTNTWVQKANVPFSLSYAVGVGCNGKGYVGTGQLPLPNPFSTGAWYEYNPTNDTWATKAPAAAIMQSTAAVINNDIYLFSGRVDLATFSGVSTNFINKYNTLNNTWSTDTAYAGGNRTFANGIHYNGKIYITGGDDSEQRTDTWEYTIATNKWARKADMPGTGFSLNGQASIDNKLYLVGGYRRMGNGTLPLYSNALLQYDAAANVWANKAAYPGGAVGEVGAFNINGELYAGCGWSGSPFISSNGFYKYNAIANTWSALPNCPNNGAVYVAFSIGDIGYFVFGTNTTGVSIMYAYNRVTNTWSIKQAVPDFNVWGGSQAGTSNTFVKDGAAYLVGFSTQNGSMAQNGKIRKYDPIADKWSYLTSAPFFKKGQTIVNTGTDVYVGFGSGVKLFDSSQTYYGVCNDWFKLIFEADVSTFVGDKNFNCAEFGTLLAGENKTFTDDEGKLFISYQASLTGGGSNICINQRSLPSSNTFRENKIIAESKTYTAMFMNKNFAFSGGGGGEGVKLRMYFTDAELAVFVANFNAKYGTSKIINDIKIVSAHNGLGTGNLDYLDNVSHAIYTPTVNNYKTGNKYLEYTFLAGQGLLEGFAALLIDAQTISFSELASKVYGDGNFVSGVSSSNATIPITYGSSNNSVATVAANGIITIVGAGTTIITASQAGNSNFSAATPVSQTLTVTKKPLTFTAVNKTRVFGSVNPIFTLNYSGFVNGDDATKLTTLPTITSTANLVSPVGTYPITASAAISSNYSFTYTAGSLTVTQAPLTITADNKTRLQGITNPALTATYTGFVNGETSNVLLTPPFLSTTANLTSESGIYSINVSGATALNYEVSHINGTLTVTTASPTITNFTPTTTIAGTAVTITGNYFTGTSAVSFGGTPAASFTVNSPTSITAIVGTGASGNVSVTTPAGTIALAGYTFVPKPTITATGQTTFATGGSVLLSVNPSTGFSYQWLKDGSNIANAKSATYTATVTGNYTVTITANNVSETSNAIVVNAIYTLPANNFKITNTSETCRSSNNGKIDIEALQANTYTAQLTGNGLNLTKPFTNAVDFLDLQAGSYKVCITVAGQTNYSQCFDVTIIQPQDLAVFSVIKADNKVTLTLSGSDLYNVELNGITQQTNLSRLELSLQPGQNILKVSTGKNCQGVIEKQFTVNPKPIIYPNPFERTLNLYNIPKGTIAVEVQSLDGKVVFKSSYVNKTGTISIELNQLNAGNYILKTSTNNSVSIFKIIKK